MSQALATTSRARFTECSIQNALYFFCYRKRHRFMVPNVQVYGWESDMVSVTRDDYVYEYEIKISRKDFLHDLQKDRHQHLTDLHAGEPSGLWPESKRRGANYLYYAVPAGLLLDEEIPKHEGLKFSVRRQNSTKTNSLSITVSGSSVQLRIDIGPAELATTATNEVFK
jgi:hypothetical protein